MRERELKKEWAEEQSHSKQPSRDRGRDQSTERVRDGETEWERGRELMRVRDEWAFNRVWYFAQTVRSVPFLFFILFYLFIYLFLNFGRIGCFGLNRPFRQFLPISADTVDTARVGPIPRESAESEPRQRESAKKSKTPRGMTRPDARAAASLARRRVRRRCGTSGGPCFIDL